eukprot:scaffold40359_cov221-Amphora_coffeaeformis.AAC.1
MSLYEQQQQQQQQQQRNNSSKASKRQRPRPPPGACCFLWVYGKCEPPRGMCKFHHDMPTDDGSTPCGFGATCRLGHAKRALKHVENTPDAKLAYWEAYNNDNDNNTNNSNENNNAHHHNTVGSSPAVRDATLLRSQLEPWSTAVLRQRLATCFGVTHGDTEQLTRGQVMQLLLEQYQSTTTTTTTTTVTRRRHHIHVTGTPVDPSLCQQLLQALQAWKSHHSTNTRPSIHATSYMILRSPREFESKQHNSHQARKAAKKIQQYQTLWNLAFQAMEAVDAEYAGNFSALAVTYGFRGSPHIDKQNTGPFYGLALGDFPDGQGGICVEADPFTVAIVNTKHHLGKVDGRYPHWVAPYKSGE